jgi:hypothetical protein
MSILVAPLAGGVNGAVSGTAELYARGTNTPVYGYSDPDATHVVDKIVTLDANGGAELYVKEPAFIRVRSSAGVIVREFNVGGDADVSIGSFTGLLPTGSQGSGGAVGLSTLLDRWHASAGANDFLVRRPGLPWDETIAAALSAVSISNLPLFNVRLYGAAGDGVTDDTFAFQLAHDGAAALGGGIIYVPGGNYLLNTAWSITSQKVSLMGAGCRASVLTIGLTSGTGITVNTLTSNYSGAYISDIQIAPVVSGANVTPLYISATPGLILRNVLVTGFALPVDIRSRTTLQNCDVAVPSSGVGATYAVSFTASSDYSRVLGGAYTQSRSASAGGLYLGATHISVSGATVDISAVVYSGPPPGGWGVNIAASYCRVTNCDIITGDSNTAGIRCGGANYHESANVFTGSGKQTSGATNGSVGLNATGYRGSRVGRTLIGTPGTAIELDLDYEIIQISHATAGTTVTVKLPIDAVTASLPIGALLYFLYTFSGTGTNTFRVYFTSTQASGNYVENTMATATTYSHIFRWTGDRFAMVV